jgi:hypothetical protein
MALDLENGEFFRLIRPYVPMPRRGNQWKFHRRDTAFIRPVLINQIRATRSQF